MLFWVLILFVTFFSAFIVSWCSLSQRAVGSLIFCLVLFLTIFAGYRDGLGTDYYNYLYGLEWKADSSGLYEYGYHLIASFVETTGFTEVFFFLIFSFVTVFFSFSVFRYSGSIAISILVFVLHPLIYFGSFNLVRQFAAAAIMLYAFLCLSSGKYVRYILLALLAVSFHMSAALLILLTPFLFLNFRLLFHAGIVFLAMFAGHFVNYDFSQLAAYFDIYSHYADYTYSVGSNLSVMIFSALYIFYLLRFGSFRFEEKFPNLYINMATIFFVLVNLIPMFYIFYRVSILFVLALPIAFSFTLKSSFDTVFFRMALFSNLLLFFSYFIYTNFDDVRVVPQSLFTDFKLYVLK